MATQQTQQGVSKIFGANRLQVAWFIVYWPAGYIQYHHYGIASIFGTRQYSINARAFIENPYLLHHIFGKADIFGFVRKTISAQAKVVIRGSGSVTGLAKITKWGLLLLPYQDVSADGWIIEPLFAQIDEYPPSTSDFIFSPVNPTGQTAVVKLQQAPNQFTITSGQLVFVYRKELFIGTVNLEINLVSSGVSLGTIKSNIGTTWTTGTIDVSSGDMEKINNSDNITVSFKAYI